VPAGYRSFGTLHSHGSSGMRSHDAETTSQGEVSDAKVPDRLAAAAFLGSLSAHAPSGTRRLAPSDVLQLQRSIGNRAVRRLIHRAPAKDDVQRPMEGMPGYKMDAAWAGPEGDRFVWDEFDRTLTIFTSPQGPSQGKALQLTYKQGTPEEIEKLAPEDRYTSVEVLSPIRAAALEFLRTEQGKYQETEADRATRVSNANAIGKRTTLCNAHTGKFGSVLAGAKANLGGFDPRAESIKAKRAGAFHTLESHPAGPKPGDIYSCGIVNPPAKDGRLRTANFFTTTHVGVFKSRRPGPGGVEIWTVVDGGQGTFEGRQETRERTRIFVKERLEVAIPKKMAGAEVKAWENKPEEIECGVLKSKLADAGQGADDKLLRGWLDIDEYFGSAPSEATSSGASNRVFVGNAAAAAAAAAPPPAAAPSPAAAPPPAVVST